MPSARHTIAMVVKPACFRRERTANRTSWTKLPMPRLLTGFCHLRTFDNPERGSVCRRYIYLMPAPDSSALDALRARGEAFLRDVSREYYSSHAGLKPSAELQPIYARHREAFGDESLELAMALLKSAAPGSDAHRSGRMLVEWLIESRVGRELAPLEEREIAWEGEAVVRLP